MKLLHISPEACDLDGHMEEWLLTSAGLRRDTRSMWRLTDYCDGQKYDRAMSSISCPRSLSVFSCGTESNSAASIIAMSKTAAAMNRAIIGASSRPLLVRRAAKAVIVCTEMLHRSTSAPGGHTPDTLTLLRRRVSSFGPCFGRLRAPGDGLRGRSTPPNGHGAGTHISVAHRVHPVSVRSVAHWRLQ